MRKIYFGLLAAAILFAAPQARAAVLYDSGSTTGNYSASNFAGGGLEGSFTLSQASVVTGVNFVAWTYQSTLASLSWGISSTSPSGILGSVSPTDVGPTYTNAPWYVSTYNFSTGSLALSAGTYYLTLQDGVTSDRSNPFWDMHPSLSAPLGYDVTFQIFWNCLDFVRPRTNYMGNDDPWLRWRWLHGLSSTETGWSLPHRLSNSSSIRKGRLLRHRGQAAVASIAQ